MAIKLNVGDIYEIDTRHVTPNPPYGGILIKVRILAFDDTVVFSDGRNAGAIYWWMDKDYKSAHVYNRMSIKIYELYGELVGHENVSKDVLTVVRPDLPLALCRIPNISWTDDCFKSRDLLSAYLKTHFGTQQQANVLDINRIYLEPCGSTGRARASIIVDADNGQYFTFEELLWKASEIRSKVHTTPSNGIGIFRSGGKKKIPTFYIWEYCDLAKMYCE
jgi:hypothetical protein